MVWYTIKQTIQLFRSYSIIFHYIHMVSTFHRFYVSVSMIQKVAWTDCSKGWFQSLFFHCILFERKYFSPIKFFKLLSQPYKTGRQNTWPFMVRKIRPRLVMFLDKRCPTLLPQHFFFELNTFWRGRWCLVCPRTNTFISKADLDRNAFKKVID